MIKIWIVIQVDKNGKCLGFRGVFLSEEEAFNDKLNADNEKLIIDDWPIWEVVEREVVT